MTPNSKRGHKFELSEDFIERLEGPHRKEAIPPENVVGRMHLSKKDVVVDLGAGIGYFAFPMAERAKEVTAVDIEQKMIDVLNQRLAERRVTNVKAIKAEV